MKKCRQNDDEKVFTLNCDIYNNSSLGDMCLSSENCFSNTVCSNRFNGKCTCQEGYQEENRKCIKENLTLRENCSIRRQCRQSNAECKNSVCSCKTGYLQIEKKCVEENKTIGSQCQYHEQCTGTHNAGLCLGNSSHLQCSCSKGFVERNRSCIGNLKLGESCSLDKQCQQYNATCKEGNCSCENGYIQIEANCVEGHKALNAPCQYHQQCTSTPNASLCVGNSSSFLCSCGVGFTEWNGSCIELPEHSTPNMEETFFDTKAFAVWSNIISLIFGASVPTLIFAVYSSRARSVENPQNFFERRSSKTEGVTLYRKTNDGSEMRRKTKCYKKSAASIEDIHEENDRNHDNDQDPCLYNHLNEKEEIESVSENKYSTAERAIHNDAENTYAQVQSRKGNSKQLNIDDVYMPVTLENDL
ncbi:matrilin-2-like [Saccostrea cucullata]|uniref:matrilin-2-like n=1 Tax=Saccostrea cuccullata TaxID=36930 RepID=UPI002ED2D6B5